MVFVLVALPGKRSNRGILFFFPSLDDALLVSDFHSPSSVEGRENGSGIDTLFRCLFVSFSRVFSGFPLYLFFSCLFLGKPPWDSCVNV